MRDFTILIVDDNQNNRFALKAALERLQVVCVEADSGQGTMEILLKESIDLIILDIQLPDYSGFEIAAMIKSKKSTMAVPIIFATAIYKTEDFIERGYELGAIDYILKPISSTVLIAKVKFYKEVHEQRMNAMRELSMLNEKLVEHNKKLIRLEQKIATTAANWKMLGVSIPYLVEVYDKDAKLLLDNENEEAIDGFCLEKIHGQVLSGYIKEALRSRTSLVKVIDIFYNGRVNYFELTIRPMFVSGEERCMVILQDVTEQHSYEENIIYMGYHDQLTNLGNRHYFKTHIEHLDKVEALPISIIMGDVNGLKMINDSFGHLYGDKLLIEAAAVLGRYLNDDDVLARWGGDEYILLLPNTDKDRLQILMDSIIKDTQDSKVEGKFPVSIALGDATAYDSSFEFEQLIKEAEDRMYVNKLRDQLSYRSSVVESLKQALYERDYETEEHTDRLGTMALMMATHLGLSQNDKDLLILLGDLHDIGKIALSKHVLNKESQLSETEWNSIKRHPEIGYRICGSVPELSAVSELILSHHERWDGNGYPRGLANTEIPLLARLISIIDAFDVMTHQRPYNVQKTEEEALEELKKCAGTQFDPNLVNVFVKVYEAWLQEV